MPRLRLPFQVPALEDLAIPSVSILIPFLAYTSQYLFSYIEPGRLSTNESLLFNALVFTIWFCYDRACTVDPGKKGWVDRVALRKGSEKGDKEDGEEVGQGKDEGNGTQQTEGDKKPQRWCKKCDAVKPPRAHHCRKCGRYIPSLLQLQDPN